MELEERKVAPSRFDQATKVFDGWLDPETRMRVLRIHTRGEDAEGSTWSTQYHQFRCFLDGGRKVLLRRSVPSANGAAMAYFLLDLATGELAHPFPSGHAVTEISDGSPLACLQDKEAGGHRAILWDMREGRELASSQCDGWELNCINLLSDGRRAMSFHCRGRLWDEPVQSRHYLLCPDEPPRLVLEADGYFCSHIQGCPTDPDLYAYDRWPSPQRYIDQALHLRTLDGRYDHPVPLTKDALRPAVMLGARDHYVWSPDGKRIVSYLCPHPFELGPDFDHYRLTWWLSVTDWRTGEDLAAEYPEGRWGGHMQISPDSSYIVCGGGPGFDKLFAVEIEGLRRGWNEQIICSYPRATLTGSMWGPFAYPFVLPDQSGVIFNAGWPGPEHGVYLAEWPDHLKADTQCPRRAP